MKSSFFVLLVIFSGSLLASCATGPRSLPVERVEVNAARVLIYWPPGSPGRASCPAYSINASAVQSVPYASFVAFDVTPGNHTLRGVSSWCYSVQPFLDVEAKAGETIYLRQTGSAYQFAGAAPFRGGESWIGLVRVRPEVARAEMGK